MALTKVTYGLLSADTSAIDLNIDANTLYVDSSANKVGIGTNSPTEKLHVNGNLRLGSDPTLNWGSNHLTLQAASDVIGVVRVYGTASHEPRFEIYSDAGSTRKIMFQPTSDSYFTGNLGIGTTSPNQWASYTDSAATVLQVRDTSERARVVINGGNGAHLDLVDYAGSTNDKHMNIAVDGGVLKFGSLNDAGNAFVQNNILIMDLGTGAIKFNNAYTFPTSDGSANQFLQTDGSGTLSFATVSSSDSTKLPLAGGTLTGALTTNGVINTGTSHNFAINTPNSLRINIDSNNSGNEIFAVGHNQTGVDASNNVLFLVQGLNGRTGIGATNLNATLQVGDGTTEGDTTNPAIQIGRTGTYRFGMYASTEGAVIENKNGDDGIQFRVKTAGEAMRIDGGTGNVGIGTTNPTGQRLCIGGHSTNNTMTEANAWFVAEAVGGDGIAIGSIASSPYTTWIQSGYLNTMGTSNHYPISLNPHGGNIGIGTNSPTQLLHLKSTGDAVLRLEADSDNVTETDNAYIEFVQDGTLVGAEVGFASGTNEFTINQKFGAEMAFKTNNVERMRILSDNTVLVNTTVDSDNQIMRIRQGGSNADPVLSLDSDTGDQSYYRYMKFYRKGQTSSVAKLDIDWSGSSIGLAFTSDARLKTVTGEADGLELITRLNPVKYVWKSEPDREGAQGFLAQEVEQAYYETGNSHARGVSRPVDGEEHYMLDDTTLIPNLVKAIKELKDENDALKARVEALES